MNDCKVVLNMLENVSEEIWRAGGGVGVGMEWEAALGQNLSGWWEMNERGNECMDYRVNVMQETKWEDGEGWIAKEYGMQAEETNMKSWQQEKKKNIQPQLHPQSSVTGSVTI